MIKKLLCRYILKISLILLLISVLENIHAQESTIDMRNIQFITYPDFPEQHSTWGDIAYSAVNNSVYVGVTNHRDKVGLYEYNTEVDSMSLKGWVSDMGYLRPFQWQGKIHSKIVTDNAGNIYFGTDGGESREEYLINNPKGYSGGFLMKYNPRANEITNYGIVMPYESIKDVDIDLSTGKIYAITYPQVHFMVFDPKTNKMDDLGRLGSAHVPRVMFTDKWGNCYYLDWRQRLVKYEKSQEKLIFAKESLPAFSGTPGASIITGVTAYAKDEENNVIYMLTYGAKIVAFYPQKNGIGKIKDLGPVWDTDPLWGPYVPNLVFGNGKLYYIAGGHGNFIKENTTVFIEMDPTTRKKNIVYEFPITQLYEATGSNVKDKDGNLYFAGRRKVIIKSGDARNSGLDEDDVVSVPFLIKFNPEKKLVK